MRGNSKTAAKRIRSLVYCETGERVAANHLSSVGRGVEVEFFSADILEEMGGDYGTKPRMYVKVNGTDVDPDMMGRALGKAIAFEMPKFIEVTDDVGEGGPPRFKSEAHRQAAMNWADRGVKARIRLEGLLRNLGYEIRAAEDFDGMVWERRS